MSDSANQDEHVVDGKFVMEPMIVKHYRLLFIEDDLEPLQLGSFFLLRPNPASLTSILEGLTLEQLVAKKDTFRAFIVEVLRVFEAEQGLKLFNACQTLSLVLYHTGNKFESVVQHQCLVLPTVDFAKVFSQRFRDVIVGDGCLTIKTCMLNTLTSLWIAFKKCRKNPLLAAIANDDIFDALIAIFSFADLRPLQSLALPVFIFLLRCEDVEKPNQFFKRFKGLEDNIGVIGICQFLTQKLDSNVERCVTDNVGEKGGVFSYMSSMMFDLFGKDNAPLKAAKSQNSSLLLFLYLAVRINRNFSIMLTSPPKSHSIVDTSDNEGSSNYSTFSLFLSYSSFIFSGFKRDNQKAHAKLCLLILWHIADEPYVQSAMQDIHLANSIALYKPAMLHRSASFEPISPTVATLSTALLELLTDFNAAHLMQQFPFFHYHISFSIIHRVLIYHKKCRIRLQSWRSLFKGLVSVINYLTQNSAKLPIDESFGLLHRGLLVINFFITYGDTFLPDAAAYDFLYYEISRQSAVFTRLNATIIEKTDDPTFVRSRNAIGKVSNQLINILSIIEHIKPKLEMLAQSYPTENQVISIVQDCFADLTLKLYEGLEIVYHPQENNLEVFVDSLTESMHLPTTPHWADKMDYNVVVDLLSSLES